MFRVIVKRPAIAVGQKGYRKQQIGIYLVDAQGVEDDFPSRMDVMRGPDDKDYPPGEYTINPASFRLVADKYGSSSLTVDRLVLSPTIKTADRKTA